MSKDEGVGRDRCGWCNYPLPAHSDICQAYHERSATVATAMTPSVEDTIERLRSRLMAFERHGPKTEVVMHLDDLRTLLSTLERPAVEVTEAMIEAARSGLGGIEMARTHLVQPSNGGFDYFYVSFAGQRIEFRMNDDRDSLRGPYGEEMAALSAKAAAAATAINDTLFELAKKSALAMHKQQVVTPDVVEALIDIRNRILCPVGPQPTLDEVEAIASAALAALPPIARQGKQDD